MLRAWRSARAMKADNQPGRSAPRTLAGATILQIVPALTDDQAARNVISLALALLRSGARALVAGAGGPLVGELQALGGEWAALARTSFNPFTLRANARALEQVITTERVDLVHAHSAAGAWAALTAIRRTPSWLVTSYFGAPPPRISPRNLHAGALAQGNRVITHSAFAADLIVARHDTPRDRIMVIPRSIDVARFDPAAVTPERIKAVRNDWRVPPGMRIVLVPGRIAPEKGQMTVVDAARILVNGGLRGVAFVITGSERNGRGYLRVISERIAAQGLGAIVYSKGHCADIAAAYAAADFVIVPAVEPTTFSRSAAEAQAMGRPVIASAVGALPEFVLAPPRIADGGRTGWLVRPDDPFDLARALASALPLSTAERQALGARARKLAVMTFAPARVVAATLDVYSSLLEGHV